MMKNTLILLWNVVIGLGLVGLYLLHFLSPKEPLAYVDSAKLLNGYQAMVDARKDYQRKAVVWQANVDTLVGEVQNGIKKYERESGAMNPKERSLSEELLKNKQRQLSDYQKAMQDKAQQEDQKMTQQVISQANSFLERYGKSHHYKIIFAATQSGNIVYAQEGMDITEQALEELNKEYKQIK